MTASVLSAIDKGTGSTVVWIHGFPLSSVIFEPQLAIPGVRHLCPDLPGFGASSFVEGRPATIDEYADLVARFMTARNVRKAAIAGVSMGGYVALAMLRRHADLVSALILVDTRETADTDAGREARHAMIEAVRERGAGVATDEMFPKMLTPETVSTRDWRVETVRRAMGPASSDGVIAALTAMAARPDSTETLRTAAVPVLAIAGDRDTITPPSDAERMASIARDGTHVVIDNAAHLSNIEQPALFNRAILTFLSRCP